MHSEPRQRKPLLPTVVVCTGIGVGLIGLAMLILDIGNATPVKIEIPRLGIDIQTASAAIVVMVIGFATALAPIVVAM